MLGRGGGRGGFASVLASPAAAPAAAPAPASAPSAGSAAQPHLQHAHRQSSAGSSKPASADQLTHFGLLDGTLPPAPSSAFLLSASVRLSESFVDPLPLSTSADAFEFNPRPFLGSAPSARTGPSQVSLSRSGSGTNSKDSTSLAHRCNGPSGSGFPTWRSSVGVSAGRWYYECTLASTGIFQFGWSRQDVYFSGSRQGCGDLPGSWGFDLCKHLARAPSLVRFSSRRVLTLWYAFCVFSEQSATNCGMKARPWITASVSRNGRVVMRSVVTSISARAKCASL